MIDNDPARLSAAKSMGAHIGCNSADAVKTVMEQTNNVGCDVVIEAVGIPATFELCQEIIALGGNIANIGVHGKEATIHLEKLWGYNLTMTMGFVNTTSTPTLMKMFEKGTLGLGQLITHGELFLFFLFFFLDPCHARHACLWHRIWGLGFCVLVTVVESLELNKEQKLTSGKCVAEYNLQKEGEEAYKTFSAAAQHKALKMIITTGS